LARIQRKKICDCKQIYYRFKNQKVCWVLQQTLHSEWDLKEILKTVQDFSEIKIRLKIEKNILLKNCVAIQKEHEEVLLRRPLWRPHDQI